MAKQTINLGTAPTGVGGDTPRSAFTKTQSNFDELYTALGASGSPIALPASLPVSMGGTSGKTPAEARAGIGAQTADTTLTELSGTGFVKKFSDNSQLTTTGWRRMPDGGINQWGLIALSAVGAFNPQTIGGQTWYTHFYIVTLPTSYASAHHSIVASLNGAPSYAQSAMTPFFLTTDKRTSSATESLTSFTVGICTPVTGWIPYLNFRSRGK